MRKFEIIGPDAEELMNYTLTRNVKKLSVGQIVYSAMCYENGMMFDDGTLLRLSETGFRWVCGDEYGGCLLYTSPSPRDATLSRMQSSA